MKTDPYERLFLALLFGVFMHKFDYRYLEIINLWKLSDTKWPT